MNDDHRAMEATEDVIAEPTSAEPPEENQSISARLEQRIADAQWYLVIFGVIVTLPIIVIALLRTKSR
jgi:hypothetical protein